MVDVRHPDFPAQVASALSQLPGVIAVMLGGSRASGTNRPDADWDFAIYYRDRFDPEQLRTVGWSGEIFPIGGWGGGVFNGGAWLQVDGRRVDVHYRDLTDVERRIADAERGHFTIEHLLFYLAGVPTYIVVAELALGRVLVGDLPRPTYPEALKQSAHARWHRDALMTLDYAAAAYASRGDVLGVAGSIARAVLQASHARLAARGVWITNEKTLVAQAGLQGAAGCLADLEPVPARLHRVVEQIRALISQ